MESYRKMISRLTEILQEETRKLNNFILIGDNSSGKSELLQSILERRIDEAVYFIDSVNRGFNIERVEFNSKVYDYPIYDSKKIIQERIKADNFNLKDSFAVLSCVEQIYDKYAITIKNMLFRFLGKEINICREAIEAGLVENKVYLDGAEIKLSSGYQALLRIFVEVLFFCDAMLQQDWTHGTVIIDEVDEYLSPKHSANIMNFLKNEFPQLNFLVTTHSLDLVKSTSESNLIILNEAKFDIYNQQQLDDDLLVEDIFTKLFFDKTIIHKSEEDEIDKQLRNLMNLKIADIWDETAQNIMDSLEDKIKLPHQKLIFKQIKGW